MMIIKFILIVFCFCFLIDVSEAHRPYAKPVAEFKQNNGNSVIIEKYFGDGILFPGPVRLQVRDKENRLLANTEADAHVAVFCPKLSFCWAFSYFDLFVKPLRLVESQLNHAPSAYQKIDKEYLSVTDKAKGFKEEPLLILLSPVIIFSDHWVAFCIMAATTFLPVFVFRLISAQFPNKGLEGKILFYVLLLLPLGAFTIPVWFILFVWFFAVGMPLIYSAIVIGISACFALRQARRIAEQDCR